ncbi:5-bromo-4-chloroindolyl phosphate hydrolysis family protein [Domibacillus epiphyticus]|uniref:5-bromo-4-chloroindolyl phosphate hydrolysis protein n=1 Tax=Domibacillus epiphyticus TaxID=1714355 RepID=A0A1V2A5D1_9BACI|nr:5-bromo-4-chloroindolyl phosphate hydrolysis family protein [Domibacillus epiphyticus]OMP66072.1 hypothetical protein BTO28_13775 [Domibacillus epiphyticus]
MRYTFYWFRRILAALAAALLVSSPFDEMMAYIVFTLSFVSIFVLYTNLSNMRIRKKYGLNRKEYYYIMDQLKDAKLKLSRLQHLFLKVRSLSSLRQVIELNSLVKRIYSVVKKEPKRFYEIESFFYSHLDSVVELAEKSALLSRKKVKGPDMKQSLIETKETLNDLSKTLEGDLRQVLARDIEHLTIELDVAQRRVKNNELTFEHVPEGEQNDDQRIQTTTGTRIGRKKR